MSWNRPLFSMLLAGTILSPTFFRNATAQVPVRVGPSTAPGTTLHPRLEPCWEVAGVSKAAVQQRRVIAQHTRQEVAAVCANSSLSIQQKRQQIQQIHQQERQQIDAIVTPSQQEAMRSCQEARNGGHSHGHVGSGQGGPCGGMSAPHHTLNAQPEEDEAPPNETKPN